MREATLEEKKKIQLNILDVVVSFCEENDIRFWLDCGTLLGAIRHKGYIPWDDDIDIGMLREDYDKFMTTFNEKNDRYQLICPEMDKNYHLPFIKVMDTKTTFFEPDERGFKLCINVDVFAYDNAPKEKRQLRRMYNKRDVFQRCAWAQLAKTKPRGNPFRRVAIRIFRFFLQCFPKGFFLQMALKNARKYESQETGFVGNFTSWSRIFCKKEWVEDVVNVYFEGKEYPAPANYDKWLRAFYGKDYMVPPPEGERKGHSFVAFIDDEVN